MKIPCMRLCIAQFPMKIPGARKNHPSGNIFIFMHGNSIFMHENDIFCDVIFHFMPRFFHAWNFSNGGSQRAVVAKFLGYVPVWGGRRLPDIDRLTAVLPRVDDVPCRTTTIANSLVSPRVYFGRTAKWIINRSSSITATMAICKPTSSGKSVVLCLSGVRKVLCIKKKDLKISCMPLLFSCMNISFTCMKIVFPYMKMTFSCMKYYFRTWKWKVCLTIFVHGILILENVLGKILVFMHRNIMFMHGKLGRVICTHGQPGLCIRIYTSVWHSTTFCLWSKHLQGYQPYYIIRQSPHT